MPSNRSVPRLAACAAAALVALAGLAHAQWSVFIVHPGPPSIDSQLFGGRGGLLVGWSQNTNNMTNGAVWIPDGAGVGGGNFDIITPMQRLAGAVMATDGTQCVGHTKTEQYGPSAATYWPSPFGLPVVLHPESVLSNDSRAFALDGDLQAGYVVVSGREHASIWHGTPESWVDLHPAGMYSSRFNDAAGGQMVGIVRSTSSTASQHATVWVGTSGAHIDLHLQGATSVALGTDGAHQVGYSYTVLLNRHASLWSGYAASMVDLHPSADQSSRSQANAVYGPYQVGKVASVCCIDHAALWTGTAASYFDLGTLLPPNFPTMESEANAVWIDGDFLYITGVAWETVVLQDNTHFVQPRAVLWKKDLRPPACGPADIAKSGGLPGHDGLLDNNDFIIFIDYFFNGDPLADRGSQGGIAAADGLFDNNDFIVFIEQFFAGC